MPRYSLGELIARANAGNIGQRGLKRLQLANIASASSGVDLGLTKDPGADLQARRASLYAGAVQAAHDLPAGQTLSAGIQRRLELGAGGPHSQNTFTPSSAAGVQAFQGDNYNTLLDALRKKSKGIGSTAGIYRGF